MTADERLARLADLAVRVGANVQAGQEVVLVYQVEQAPVARAIARAALGVGARRVVPLITDMHLRKAAIELGPPDELGVTPRHLLDWARSWRETLLCGVLGVYCFAGFAHEGLRLLGVDLAAFW